MLTSSTNFVQLHSHKYEQIGAFKAEAFSYLNRVIRVNLED